jgi:Domain of unknown function (DUF4112)
MNELIDPQLERLAALMDNQFEVLGFKFGLNLIIDFIPWVGDFISTTIALYIFTMALKYRISYFVIFRMLLNIGIFFMVGLVPWLGDLFGAWWKPNIRNLNLLRRNLK